MLTAAKFLPDRGATMVNIAEILNCTLEAVEANYHQGNITSCFVEGERLISKDSVLWAIRNQKFKTYKIIKE